MNKTAWIFAAAVIVAGNFGWLWALAVLAVEPAIQMLRAAYRAYIMGPAFESHYNDLPDAPPVRFTLDDVPAAFLPQVDDLIAMRKGDVIRSAYRTVRRIR